MKQRTRSILVVSLWLFVGVVVYSLNKDDTPTAKVGNYVDAVVECQEVITSRFPYQPIKFDNAFKYKGTKVITEGSKFQVAGKVNGRPYGCIVHFEDDKYIVEGIQ